MQHLKRQTLQTGDLVHIVFSGFVTITSLVFCFGLFLACHQRLWVELAGTHKYFKKSKLGCVCLVCPFPSKYVSSRNLLACVPVQTLANDSVSASLSVSASGFFILFIIFLAKKTSHCCYNFNYHLGDFCAVSRWKRDSLYEWMNEWMAQDRLPSGG